MCGHCLPETDNKVALDDDLSDLIGGAARPHTPMPEDFKPAIERMFTEPCKACGGSGRWGTWGSRPCFKCKGTGKQTFKTAPETRKAVRVAKGRSLAQKIQSFQTEHPEIWAWMKDSTFPFAVSLRDEGVLKYGGLRDGQIEAALASIAKYNAAKAASKARVTEAKKIDMTLIDQAFAKASAKLRTPRLTIGNIVISHAPAGGKNPGALYVKDNGMYLGKIIGEAFIRSRDCRDDQQATLFEVAADPKEAAIKHGRLTGNCAICGRSLTKESSVDAGIGPICAARFGW